MYQVIRLGYADQWYTDFEQLLASLKRVHGRVCSADMGWPKMLVMGDGTEVTINRSDDDENVRMVRNDLLHLGSVID